MLVLLARERVEDAARGDDQPPQILAGACRARRSAARSVDEALELCAARGGRLGHARQVAVQRLEPLEDGVEVVSMAAQPLAGAGYEQLQVRPRVGVERGVDLVGIDVRQRVARRNPRRPRAAPARCPGVTSRNMSLSAVFGRSSALASRRIRFSYSRSISSCDDGAPVAQADLADPARPRRRPRAPSGPGRAGPPARRPARPRSASAVSSKTGKRSRCWPRMEIAIAGGQRQQAERSRGSRAGGRGSPCFIPRSRPGRRTGQPARWVRRGSAAPGSRRARRGGAPAACASRAAAPARSCRRRAPPG